MKKRKNGSNEPGESPSRLMDVRSKEQFPPLSVCSPSTVEPSLVCE